MVQVLAQAARMAVHVPAAVAHLAHQAVMAEDRVLPEVGHPVPAEALAVVVHVQVADRVPAEVVQVVLHADKNVLSNRTYSQC